MNHDGFDGFENYRRQRERMKKLGDERRPLSGPSNAMRELEAAEAREERERQINLEVQDFLASATRTAAMIVQKVAESAKVRIDNQLSEEMQDFLRESMTRMQGLVTAVLKDNRGSTAEQVIEPLMHNLVGQLLDTFRSEGTAGTDKHLGMDPLATNLEDVRREFQAKMPPPVPTDTTIVTETKLRVGPATVSTPAEPAASPLPAKTRIDDHLAAELQAAQGDKGAMQQLDAERFEQALDTLVQKGQLSADEAKAAVKARKPGRH